MIKKIAESLIFFAFGVLIALAAILIADTHRMAVQHEAAILAIERSQQALCRMAEANGWLLEQ